MKHLYIKFSALFVISLLIGCTSKPLVSPSQNNELSNITNSNKTLKNGYMQNSLNSWLKNDWEPTIHIKEKKEIQENTPVIVKEDVIIEKNIKVKKESDSFTLQKYVDKASIYMKANETDKNNAHYKKIGSLPAIGK